MAVILNINRNLKGSHKVPKKVPSEQTIIPKKTISLLPRLKNLESKTREELLIKLNSLLSARPQVNSVVLLATEAQEVLELTLRNFNINNLRELKIPAWSNQEFSKREWTRVPSKSPKQDQLLVSNRKRIRLLQQKEFLWIRDLKISKERNKIWEISNNREVMIRNLKIPILLLPRGVVNLKQVNEINRLRKLNWQQV